MLLDVLEDPVFARAVARRLALPTFPIQGAACGTFATTIGHGDFGSGCSPADTGDYSFSSSKVGIGTTAPDKTLTIYRAPSSTAGDVALGLSYIGTPESLWGFRLNASSYDLILDRKYQGSWQTTPPVTIQRTTGNVGIGTTSPDNRLHVMDGHVAIEATASQGKLKFRDSGDHTTRNEIYRDSNDFTILRNWNQDYTILKIWAPTGAVLNNREATLTLVRGDDDEEFMDIYNNGYTSETQYGIRIVKNTGGQFRDFVFDQWDKTQTPDVKTPLMILKTDGKVGIGESSPDYKLDVNGPLGFTPGSSVTPVDNGDVVFQLTNNTTLTIKAKGSDGTVRSATISLA